MPARRFLVHRGVRVALAKKDVFIRAAVLGAHDDVDDGVDAGRQVDEYVAGDVEAAPVHRVAVELGDGDGQVADEEGHEDHADHLQELAVLRRHVAAAVEGTAAAHAA